MSEQRAYVYRDDLRVWTTPSHSALSYSDGQEVEERLLLSLRQCRDVSAASEDLRSHITDWPSEYHFSPVRHNLLRPFSFRPTDRVLELGCGCGALTRYLGESGATVVALEGSLQRATIAAERCRDLPNVRIYCDNIVDFATDEKFDYVTLIGVLEYAPVLVTETDPVHRALEAARRWLRVDGALLLAIENQLGLKYLSGCSEDHLGVAYIGVEDLYPERSPVTFGRVELEQRMREAGFRQVVFAYPFPDYKTPEIIISEEGVHDPELDVASLLAKSLSRDQVDNNRAFREILARFPVARNGLLGHLANSFLVLASPSELNFSPTTDWLASAYAHTRALGYRMETRFTREDGKVIVRKKFLCESGDQIAGASARFHCKLPPATHYLAGRLLLVNLQRHGAAARWLPEFAEALGPWIKLLKQIANSSTLVAASLPPNFVDCIPANIIVTPDGEPHFFDSEWVANQRIPAIWVLVRGIANALTYISAPETSRGTTLQSLIQVFLRHHRIEIDEPALSLAASWEDEFATASSGRSPRPGFSEMLRSTLWALDGICYHNAVRVRLETEIQRMRSTWSWKLATPVRALENRFRKGIQRNPTFR